MATRLAVHDRLGRRPLGGDRRRGLHRRRDGRRADPARPGVTLIEQAATALTTVDPELGRSSPTSSPARRALRVRGPGQRIERRDDAWSCSAPARPVPRAMSCWSSRAWCPTPRWPTTPAPLGCPRRAGGRSPDADRAARFWAAGDCTETYHRLLDHNVYLPLGSTAHKQGRVAGENAVGGSAEFAGTLGTQVVKVFDLAVAGTGLRETAATAEGFDPLTVQTVTDDHKAYYPGAHPLRCGSSAIAVPASCSAPRSSGTSPVRSPSGSTRSRPRSITA